jgi:hypothetical protein
VYEGIIMMSRKKCNQEKAARGCEHFIMKSFRTGSLLFVKKCDYDDKIGED